MNNGLLVSQTSYELTKAAQQINIQVQANVKFSVEIDNGCKDWVKYNTTKGLTTSTVVLDIAENKTYDTREGKVTIKQDGGNLSSTITIKQSQLDGLFITTPEYNLSNEKHTLTVEVSTNVEFDVKPEADWVKYVQTKGLNTKQIVLEVAENDTYDQRETKVNVKQKNGDLSGVITIKQDEKYGILVTQPEYSLSNEAAVIDVEVKYNVDFDVVIPDECKEWIKQISTKGLDSKIYTFSVAKNETYDNREGSITFKQKKGAISTTVAIKQAQKEGLIAEKTEYIISSEEQQLNIKVKSNINYEVDIDDSCKDWLSRIQTKGLVEETLSFQVAKNEGETRTGKVILKNESLQETITIKQEAEGYVEFADDNFKSYCVANFDLNGDGEISMKEAEAVTQITVNPEIVASLKGIEYFKNLESLSCSLKWNSASSSSTGHRFYRNGEEIFSLLTSLDLTGNKSLTYLSCSANNLTSLDVSNNTALTYLNCNLNQLTSLDVSKNTALDYLNCYSNQLTSLDVSKNTQLLQLDCSYNQLTSLDVSKNTALTVLDCDHNQLTSLDVSKNTALIRLGCEYNQLTSLDVSNNKVLEYLWCTINQLTSLDVSKNTALTTLYCDLNRLTSLDVSKNTALTYLNCSSNQLTSLDVSNNTALRELYCYNNPYLAEIWLKMGQTIATFSFDIGVATIKYKVIPEAVDLGLSVKWATFNVGASSPEEYGDYFAWGEVEPYYSSQDPLTWKDGKTGYTWDSYKWCNGSEESLTKYNTSAWRGTVDNKTVLEAEDDVVHVKLGGSWRMPTVAEWTELRENCTWTWTTQNGVNGRLVTSNKNGNSIFLPAAGTRVGPVLNGAGSNGYYWSSSLFTDDPSTALDVNFNSSYVSWGNAIRECGRSVRPVCE